MHAEWNYVSILDSIRGAYLITHITLTPCDCAFLCCCTALISLAFDACEVNRKCHECQRMCCGDGRSCASSLLTQIHDMITTNGALRWARRDSISIMNCQDTHSGSDELTLSTTISQLHKQTAFHCQYKQKGFCQCCTHFISFYLITHLAYLEAWWLRWVDLHCWHCVKCLQWVWRLSERFDLCGRLSKI